MKHPERIRIKDIARMAGVSVGTVDRVLHGRAGVASASRQRVEEILRQMDYHPNIYASALASNKKYAFACLLPSHLEGEYWTAVEVGIRSALAAYADFHITIDVSYYDPYDYRSFANASHAIAVRHPDGVLLAPTAPEHTRPFTTELKTLDIPYIYVDSNLADQPALSFLGQDSRQSGRFAAHMLSLLAGSSRQFVLFRRINAGIVGSNQQERREVGFRDYVGTHCPDCTVLECDLPIGSAADDFRNLDHFFDRHPDARAGITFNSKVYAVGEYLQARGIADFRLMGYDLLARNVACLRAGSVDFLIAQQPELQGYNAIKALADHLIFRKEVPPLQFMPIDLLSRQNIDFYHPSFTIHS
ncbi:MAG: LacI family DNA-binding transcriptional regulator [Prevotellaceae bacterium]|jgi:LacI family transcriptional regulator|nr:LacI family DNA-binding transcriptional regulator [Prevotellaceae bacterium]